MKHTEPANKWVWVRACVHPIKEIANTKLNDKADIEKEMSFISPNPLPTTTILSKANTIKSNTCIQGYASFCCDAVLNSVKFSL